MKEFIVSREVKVITREIHSVIVHAPTEVSAFAASYVKPDTEWRLREILDMRIKDKGHYEVSSEVSSGPRRDLLKEQQELYNAMMGREHVIQMVRDFLGEPSDILNAPQDAAKANARKEKVKKLLEDLLRQEGSGPQ